MLLLRISCRAALSLLLLLVVWSSRPLLAAPGDLDASFQPAYSDIAAIQVRPGSPNWREWKMAVQRADGTVAFLEASGKRHTEFPTFPGSADYLGLDRPFPYRGFHALPDGRILAMDPARIINPGRGLSWPLFGSDPDRAVDGAVLEDNSILLGGTLTHLSSAGFETPLDPSIERLGRLRHFIPDSEGRWYVLRQADESQRQLWRLTPSGVLDETFDSSEAWQCTAVAPADAGKCYVAYEDFISGRMVVARLLNHGGIDRAFEAVDFTVGFGEVIRALAFDAKSGGVFVGIRRTLPGPEAAPSLYFIDREGEVNSFFTENAAVEGAISRLVLADDNLYVLGELKERGASEVSARIVRLEADTEAFEGPQFTFPLQDAEVSVGSRHAMSAWVVGEGEVSYQWFKNGEPIPGATDSDLVFDHVRFEDAGSYQLTVSDRVGSRQMPEAQLTVSGLVSEMDPNFEVDSRISIGWPGQPGWFSAVLPDGKLIMQATYQNDQGYERGLVRLNADGSLDETFPLLPFGPFYDAVAAADGTVYGRFDCEGCSAEERAFGRRFPNGEVEIFPMPDGFEEPAETLTVIQPLDGKILRTLRSSEDAQISLLRFHPDGMLDPAFRISQADEVQAVLPLRSGKILIGGKEGLLRLNADGSLDASFDVAALGDFKNVVQLVTVGDRVAASNGSLIKMMDGEGVIDASFAVEGTQAFHEISIDLAGRVYLDRVDSELHLRLQPNGALDWLLPVDVSPYEDETITFRPHLDGMLVFPLQHFSFYDSTSVSNWVARVRPVGDLPVAFADPRLEAALQGFLEVGEAPVTVAQLSALEELRLDGRGITDLRGLENAHRLKLLSIRNNQVRDLEPLRDLAIDELFTSGNPLAEPVPQMAVATVSMLAHK